LYIRDFCAAVVSVVVVISSVANAATDGGSSYIPPPDVPPSAAFTGPADTSVLPPPAPIPGGLEESLQLYQANEVVYTGKRAQALREIPMTISYIPSEELEGTGQFTLCEAIQYFPGMECRRGPMRKAAISAQGLGSNFLSNRLLLLKDGRPLTDPWTGIFYPDETTPLINTKQIEVIRGPGSSLYGSNAFSGVINIIQRTPDDLIKEGNDIGADLRLLGGQDKTIRAQATVAGKAGPVKGLVNFYKFNSAGPELFSDPKLGVVDTQEWSNVTQVGAKVQGGPVTVDFDYNTSDLGRPGGAQISAVGNCGRCHYTPNDSEHVETLTGSVQGEGKVTDWLTVFGEAYGYMKRRQVQQEDQITKELRPSLGKRRRFGGEIRALINAGPVNVTVGGDVKNDLVNNQNITAGLGLNDLQETIIGVFADGQYKPFHKLAIGAGLRFDYYAIPTTVWANPRSELSPRASIIFQARNDLHFRINYGRAFRAPTFAELAINQQMYASTLLGNPNLKAETMDTVEAAVDWWVFDGSAKLGATGFFKKANNFIQQEFLLGSTSRFRNIGDARIWGLELNAAAQFKQLRSSIDLSYQLLNTRTLPIDGISLGGALDYAPTHRFSLRGHTNITDNLFVDLYGTLISERQDPALQTLADGTPGSHIILPAYVVASARAGVRIQDRFTFSIVGSNIFNTQYQETNGFPAPRMSLFAEAKFTY